MFYVYPAGYPQYGIIFQKQTLYSNGIHAATIKIIHRKKLESLISNKIENIILAFLFVSPEPLSFTELSEGLSLPIEEVKKRVNEINSLLHSTSLELVLTDNSVKLTVKTEYMSELSAFFKRKPQRLSDAAIETLAIIAYKQPVTRQEIELIRGVDCEKALQTLLDARLIKTLGNLKIQGAPFLYSITEECLYKFGFKSYGELNNTLNNILRPLS
jgi:segregation and condensation protein B